MTTPDWEQRPSLDAPSYEREYRFGDSKLIIRFGDITRSDAEVRTLALALKEARA